MRRKAGGGAEWTFGRSDECTLCICFYPLFHPPPHLSRFLPEIVLESRDLQLHYFIWAPTELTAAF